MSEHKLQERRRRSRWIGPALRESAGLPLALSSSLLLALSPHPLSQNSMSEVKQPYVLRFGVCGAGWIASEMTKVSERGAVDQG